MDRWDWEAWMDWQTSGQRRGVNQRVGLLGYGTVVTVGGVWFMGSAAKKQGVFEEGPLEKDRKIPDRGGQCWKGFMSAMEGRVTAQRLMPQGANIKTKEKCENG